MINSQKFYSNYYGHDATELKCLITHLKQKGKKSFIYLAGDSSLDSKHWFQDVAAAVNGFETILQPPQMKQDIAYFFNQFCSTDDKTFACVNCAVEEATIASKTDDGLCAQDKVIRDNITSNDILIVNIGGNDIALRPSLTTLVNIAKLMLLNSEENLLNEFENCWGVPHFIELFREQVQSYVSKIICKCRPKKVIICMIYYPSETPDGWAQQTLEKLNYFEKPQFLQLVIRQLFQHATRKISLDVPLFSFPMYSVLNGKDETLYCAGVEPSARGNYFLARALWPICVD